MHVAVLGAYGSAGAAAARKLSNNLGDPVSELTLIDGGEPGGLCILRGCMPSKAVLSSAKVAHKTHADNRVSGTASVDLESTIEHKNKHINSFAEHKKESVESLAEDSRVSFRSQNAQFLSEDRLQVGDDIIEPDYTIVATGSTPRVPHIDGLDDVDFLAGRDILDAQSLPESVVVMGFGAVGMEMSAYLASCGVDVTVIEHDSYPMDEASDMFGAELINLYRDEFDIDILTNVYEQRLESTTDGVRLHVDGDGGKSAVTAEKLCLLTGRVPTVEGLGLANIGVKPLRDWVTDTQRVVGSESVYAAGDVTGDNMILHVAKDEGKTAVQNIINTETDKEPETSTPTTHRVYFTGVGKYPYARFGKAAATGEQDGDVVITRDASDDGIFKLKNARHGKAALVVDPDTGVVKGYEGLHLHADVMAKTAQLMVETEMQIKDVPDVAYHPTTPELLDGLIRDAQRETQ